MPSRHTGRVLALMGLYQIDLVDQDLKSVLEFQYYDKPTTAEEREYATFLIKGVVENLDLIDTYIQDHSENWELSRISPVNRAILRLSVLSLLKEPLLPYQVVINEALELTREFETQESVKFINGVLDSIRRKLNERRV